MERGRYIEVEKENEERERERWSIEGEKGIDIYV